MIALKRGALDSGMSPKWRLRLGKVIIETDTQAGRLYDIVLFWPFSPACSR
jgi:hypothetical protein